MAEGDVVDIEEFFVTLLAIPDLEAGVAGVLQNGTHGDLAPDSLAGGAVAIAGSVVAGRGEDPISGQSLSDRVEP
ncbi:MAG: hypothetical protein KJO18_06610 [Acidimicrobiia bacterium]|nr:hypothetical protein [Acidimicrobiia bacterium]